MGRPAVNQVQRIARGGEKLAAGHDMRPANRKNFLKTIEQSGLVCRFVNNRMTSGFRYSDWCFSFYLSKASSVFGSWSVRNDFAGLIINVTDAFAMRIWFLFLLIPE